MNIIFGNKEEFAIDILPSEDGREGVCFIWINGKRIGDGEGTYLRQKMKSLRRVHDLSNIPELDIESNSPKFILRHILKVEELDMKTLIGLGMGFDSYIYRTYKYNGNVVLLWVYFADRTSKLNLKKHIVECERISSKVYESIVKEFEDGLDHYGKSFGKEM